MTPIELLDQYRSEMTKSELQAADYIKTNTTDIARYTLTKVAKRSGCSNAVIIRLCQKLGYDGYSEFKFSVSKYLLSNVPNGENDNTDPIQKITNTYIQFISQIPGLINKGDIWKLASFINSAKNISIWGMNRTYLAASQLSSRLMRIGILSNSTADKVHMLDISSVLKEGDLCILFSIAGKGNPDYPEMFRQLRKRGCTTALVTMSPKLKSIIVNSDISIVLPCIGQMGELNFYDDQAIYLVFIEILLYEVAKLSQNK